MLKIRKKSHIKINPRKLKGSRERYLYLCELQKVFGYKDNLRVHINASHIVKKFSCKLFKKIFAHAQSLKLHIKVVHEGYRFTCTYSDCNEQFERKEQLTSHILSHQGKFLFMCDHCGKGYNHKGNYKAHLNTHMASKPYKCGVCNEYATAYPYDFKRHLHVCKVEPNIKCPIRGCKVILKCKAYLWDHLCKFHQQGDPIVCPNCGKEFWYFFSLKAHMKTHKA